MRERWAETPPAEPETSSGRRPSHRLAALLRERFALSEEDVHLLVSDVEWRVLRSGDLTSPLLSARDREWLLVSGRLDGLQPPGREVAVGCFLVEGRVGRRLLVAGLDGSALDDVAGRAPELAVARGVATPARRPSQWASVTAVVVGPGLDPRYEVSRLADGLAPLGSVTALWPHRVDTMLGVPGIAQREMGDPGDFEVAELLQALEGADDHLVLEVESGPTAWSRRALETADQIAVLVHPDSGPMDLDCVSGLLDHAPPLTTRILVRVGAAEERPQGTADMVARLECGFALHLGEGRGEAERVARTITGNGRGLVMSGGGARGFAHLGVYRALTEMGIVVDIFGGSSIGTPLAAGMADGYPPGELDAIASRLFADVLDYTVPVAAFTGGRGIARASEEVFGERDIEDLRLPFFGISTNLTEARMHVHTRGSVVHAIRASCAVPGFMPPVPHNGDLLVDGGVTNNLPIDVMRELAPRGEVIAVDVAPSRGPVAREEYGLWVSGTRVIRDRLRGRRSVPPLSMTLMRALTIGSGSRHEEMGLSGLADRLIELDIRGVPMFEFDRVAEIARRGYELARPEIEAWAGARTGEG